MHAPEAGLLITYLQNACGLSTPVSDRVQAPRPFSLSSVDRASHARQEHEASPSTSLWSRSSSLKTGRWRYLSERSGQRRSSLDFRFPTLARRLDRPHPGLSEIGQSSRRCRRRRRRRHCRLLTLRPSVAPRVLVVSMIPTLVLLVRGRIQSLLSSVACRADGKR